tara:strand:- start:3349 stop:3453 length:105 start_codon:yes stop_codon:yes gene_type:complete
MLKIKRVVYPKAAAKSFREWLKYIKTELKKNKKQ